MPLQSMTKLVKSCKESDLDAKAGGQSAVGLEGESLCTNRGTEE